MRTIIAQIDKFFKNCFILLFVDKNAGRIKINTATKNIADIICSVSIQFMILAKIFWLFQKNS